MSNTTKINVSVPPELMPLFHLNVERLGNSQPAKLFARTLLSAKEEIEAAMSNFWYDNEEDYDGEPLCEMSQKDCAQTVRHAGRAIEFLEGLIDAANAYAATLRESHAPQAAEGSSSLPRHKAPLEPHQRLALPPSPPAEPSR